MTIGTRLAVIAGAACAIAALTASAALAASPWVVTLWHATDISQEVCLTRAEQAIPKAGFRASQSLQESRFGGTGDYTVLIRCVAKRNIIFFLVAGPDSVQADRYLTQLEGAFNF